MPDTGKTLNTINRKVFNYILTRLIDSNDVNFRTIIASERKVTEDKNKKEIMNNESLTHISLTTTLKTKCIKHKTDNLFV